MVQMADRKILIVDDDARNIFALSAVLKSRGFACLAAPSGEEALRIIKDDDSVAVILLDMMMPDMDGYEVLGVLRNGPAGDIPVVAVTAQAMVGDREKCLAAGADEYLSKPVNIDDLIIILARHIPK